MRRSSGVAATILFRLDFPFAVDAFATVVIIVTDRDVYV